MQEACFTECYFHHGNDCAYTVGIHIGGTVENFANMMSKKAKEIGALNTSFANPHGLDNENHYSTAYDLAIITRYALRNKYINEAVQTKSATINFGSFSKLLNNTNALLKTYPNADGVKTGFTNGANRCLIASATNNEQRYIAVVLGADTTKIRFSNSQTLLEESFKRYQKMDISKYLNFYINIPVKKGKLSTYERQVKDSMSLPLTSEEYEKIHIEQSMVSELIPPVVAGTKIGEVKALIGNEEIYKKDIYLDENIFSKTPKDYFKEAIKNIFEPIPKI